MGGSRLEERTIVPAPEPPMAAQIEQLHRLYCQLTGQNLSLRFDRQRTWYEFLHAGFSAPQLTQVVAYLQKEIRHNRRNVGALKLSNLLQPDRFEEDLNISRVRLRPPPPLRPASPPQAPTPSEERLRGRQLALQRLRQLKDDLRHGNI